MFPSARWKAYLRSVQEDCHATGEDNGGRGDNIYRIYHSQDIWFTQDDASTHSQSAREYLERCDALLGECTAMVDALEDTLASTPKPSQVLDWSGWW